MGLLTKLLCIHGALLLASCATDNDLAEQPTEVDVLLQPFQSAAAGDHDHGDMTKLALGFLKPAIADNVASGNEYADAITGPYKKLSKHHFDNCRMSEAFGVMQDLYSQTVEAFNPATTSSFDAAASFGLITHAAQDFYAHSNWVEAGKTTIYSRDEWRLPSALSGESLAGLAVLRAGMPNASTLSRAAGSRVPTILIGGISTKGLMTGTYDNTDTSVCPGPVAIQHGTFLAPDFWGPYDGFLAKDWPRSPHHDDALALAKTQTKEEFCRLDRMVGLRFGLAGQNLLRNAWIGDMPAFLSACPNNAKLIASLIVL